MERFAISTEDINEYGFWILTSGVDLKYFLQNPVMLFEHETMDSSAGWKEKLPIGKWTDVYAKDGVISGVPEFDQGDSFAMEVKRKVENGYLNAVSGGFKPIETSEAPVWIKPGQTRATLIKSRLKEASFVKFPGNLNAVRLYDNDENLVKMSDSAGVDAIISLIKNNINNMKAIAAYIGLSENASEADVLARLKVILSERTEALIEMGKEKGVVTEKNEAQYRKLADSDYESTKALILSEKPVQKSNDNGDVQMSITELVKQLKGEGGQLDKSTWNFNDWSEKDPEGLAKMRAEEPEKYGKLAKEYRPKRS